MTNESAGHLSQVLLWLTGGGQLAPLIASIDWSHTAFLENLATAK